MNIDIREIIKNLISACFLCVDAKINKLLAFQRIDFRTMK